MVDVVKALDRVVESHEFGNWKEENNKSYVCSFFRIQDTDAKEETEWQISFYNPETDRITSFIVPNDGRKSANMVHQDEKIFKEAGETVEKLQVKQVKIDDRKALKAALTCLREKYPNEREEKEIMLLQENKELKCLVWNVTMITSTFNIFNVKIDAKNAAVLEESLKSALDLKKSMEELAGEENN